MLFRCIARIPWRGVRPVLISILLAGCVPGACTKDNELVPLTYVGTDEFLDTEDFGGAFQPLEDDSGFGGQSVFSGRLVFINLPRTIVDDVLPADLHLAANESTTIPDLHPVLLLHGRHMNTEWTFPLYTQPIGTDYQELIVIIPFVQRGTSSNWYNYMVRIYLDNYLATWIGNSYYGYFKEMAALVESSAGASAKLDILRVGIHLFDWTAEPTATSPAPFLDNATALSELPNYGDALEIIGLPMLGTLVDAGGHYICSQWDWNLDDALVRPIRADLQFRQSFRYGMASWVSLGATETVPEGAFEIRNINWAMAYPPVACSF